MILQNCSELFQRAVVNGFFLWERKLNKKKQHGSLKESNENMANALPCLFVLEKWKNWRKYRADAIKTAFYAHTSAMKHSSVQAFTVCELQCSPFNGHKLKWKVKHNNRALFHKQRDREKISIAQFYENFTKMFPKKILRKNSFD